MNRVRKRYILCIAAIIFLMVAAKAKIKSEIVPHIYSENIVNVCDSLSKKRVLFFVAIDNITRGDSLFGYDIEIKYDTTKLKILNYVNGNTLSEFFDINFNYGLNGKISGYGITHNVMDPPSYGDSLLIGFSAEWLGNCPDTAAVEIVDMNFTSEFKRNYDSLGGGHVLAIKLPKGNIELNFQENSITLGHNDSIAYITLSIKLPKYHNTKQIMMKFNMKDSLKLMDVIPNNDNVDINNLDTNYNSFVLNNLNNGISEIIMTAKFRIINNNNIANSLLTISDFQSDECSCILNFKSDSILIEYDTLGVRNETQSEIEYIYIDQDYIEIENEGQILNVTLYDYIGNIVEQINSIEQPIIKIYLNKYKTGIYFLVLEETNKNEIKKIYKYYSN